MADMVLELGNGTRLGEREIAAATRSISMAAGRMRTLGQDEEKPGIIQTLLGFVGDGIGLLGEGVGFPLGLIATGADFVINAIADVAREVPLVGTLIAEILVGANTIIGFGLKLPSEILGVISSLLTAFRKLPEDKQKELEKKAEDKIVEKARETGQQGDVEKVLKSQEDKETKTQENKTVNTALGIGIPVLAGAGLGTALAGPVGLGGGIALGLTAGGAGIGLSALLGAFE